MTILTLNMLKSNYNPHHYQKLPLLCMCAAGISLRILPNCGGADFAKRVTKQLGTHLEPTKVKHHIYCSGSSSEIEACPVQRKKNADIGFR